MVSQHNIPIAMPGGITLPWEHPMTEFMEGIVDWCAKTLPHSHYTWDRVHGFTQDPASELWDKIYVLRLSFYNKSSESLFLLKYGDFVKEGIYF